MTSSTSSSRRPFVKILLVILLGMGASVALVRGFVRLNGAGAETIIGRELEALAAVPRIIAEPDDLALVFGSSMTEVGFAARQFDREMAERGVEIKSFNFGFGGLNPYFQDYLARRIRDAFVENDRRLRLALVEFTPLQNTKARYQGSLPTIDSYIAMLASDAEIWQWIKRDPTRGIRLANIRYLRDHISAEITTWYFGDQWFGSERPRSDVPEDEAATRKLEELGPELNKRFAEDYPDYVNSLWSWEWQGSGTIPEERSEETLALFEEYYAALRNQRRLTDDKLWRVQCCDVEDLDFEEELLAAFIRTVKTLQEFSDHVEIVLVPVNADWIQRPAEAQERLRQVLQRIHSETGATIRDFEDAPQIAPTMFSDTTHLSRYGGDVVYTRLLAETYAPLLQR